MGRLANLWNTRFAECISYGNYFEAQHVKGRQVFYCKNHRPLHFKVDKVS